MRFDPGLDREHHRKMFDIAESDRYGVAKVYRWMSTWAQALAVFDLFQLHRVSAYQRQTSAAIIAFEIATARFE